MVKHYLIACWILCGILIGFAPAQADVDAQFVGQWQTNDPERQNAPVTITIGADGAYHAETRDLLHNRTDVADGDFSASDGHWSLKPTKGKASSGTYQFRDGLFIIQTETVDKPKGKGILGTITDRLRPSRKGTITTYWKHSLSGPSSVPGKQPSRQSSVPERETGQTRSSATTRNPLTGAIIRNESPFQPLRAPVTLKEGDIPRAMELFWLHDYPTAFPYLLAAAKTGNAEAAAMVGRIYIQGVGAPKDMNQGLTWVRYSAEHGDPEGEMAYAQMYQRGVGVPQSDQEMMAWYRKAAAQHSARAEYNLAAILEQQNPTESKALLHQAAAQGLDRAAQTLRFQNSAAAFSSYKTGINALDAGNFPQALGPLEHAAGLGLADAKTMLGWMYENGKGVTENYKRAFDYYSQAANAGDDKGQSSLGAMYELGRGVTKNWATAASWYARSAAQNSETGMFRLARAYEFGIGVPQSREKAVDLYHAAGKLGSMPGAYYAIWLRDPTNVDFRTGADQAAYIAEMNASFARAHAQIYRQYGRAKEWEGNHPGADPDGNPFRH